MKGEEVNIKYLVYWRFKEYPYLKITKKKQIINSLTCKMLVYHPRGFYIGNRYVKRKDLNQYLERIPKQEKLPF